MPKAAARATHLDVVSVEPIAGPVLWFEFDEVDARLLAKGIASVRVREAAAACVAWLDEDPAGFVDRTRVQGRVTP